MNEMRECDNIILISLINLWQLLKFSSSLDYHLRFCCEEWIEREK